MAAFFPSEVTILV